MTVRQALPEDLSALATLAAAHGPVVDIHAHLGRSHSTGVVTTARDLLAVIDAYELNAAMVMPQPTDPAAFALHADIAALGKQYPGTVFGIVLLDPRQPEATYQATAERLVVGEGFVALKLHTFGHDIAPDDEVSEKVFRVARRLGRPVMVHTGLGGPHTLPDRVRPVARAFSDVPIVLCHAGFAAFWNEAIKVAEDFENVYLEPSWCPGFSVACMVERIGAHRIVFGSDHLANLPIELMKIAALGLSPAERTAVLFDNAVQLFALPVLPSEESNR